MAKLPTESQLDLDYLQMLRKIKPYITCIINTHYIGLIKQWLEKLSHDEFCDRQLRNMYLLRLGKQIESGILEEPFIKPPSDGPLDYFSDDDNEPFYAAKEVLSSQTIQPLSPQDGQGDGIMHDSDIRIINPADEEECNSWLDCSELSSTQFSDFKEEKIDRLTKMVEQLRYENNELMSMINKNNNVDELEQDRTDKVVELQKQLASAMLKNVELQKSVQTSRDLLDMRDNDSVMLYRKELEIVKDKFEKSLAKREELTSIEQQIKNDEFKKKYAELEKMYRTKYNTYTETKNAEYDKQIKRMEQQMEAEYSKKQQQLEENKTRELEEKLLHYKVKDESTSQIVDVKLEDIRLEHQKQLENLNADHLKKFEDLRNETRQKSLAQSANYRMLIEEDRNNYQELIKERRLKWRKEMAEQQVEQQKQLEENRKALHKEIEEVRQKYLAKFDDLHKKYKRSCEQNQALKKQIEELNLAHDREISGQQLAYKKELNKQVATYQMQIEKMRENQTQSEEQLAAHQKAIDGMKLKHAIAIQEAEKKYLLLEEKWETQRVQLKQTLDAQRLQNLQKLEAQRNQHKKIVEEKNKEILKAQEVAKEEFAKLQNNVSTLTSEFEKSINNCDHLKKKIAILKNLIDKMEVIHKMVDKEYNRKIGKLYAKYRMINKTNKILLTTRKLNFLTPDKTSCRSNFDEILNNLEEKYKGILAEQQDAVRKENNALKLKISEMRNVMTLSQQVEFI